VRRLVQVLLAVAGLSAALPASAAFTTKKALGPNDRIDLNRASTVELMRLPGVGQKKAQAIVAQRTRQPFRKPEDVVMVKGLGPAWFAKVKPHLVVGTPLAATSTPSVTGPPAAATAVATTARK
jgi:competence protein ComEA